MPDLQTSGAEGTFPREYTASHEAVVSIGRKESGVHCARETRSRCL